MLAGGRRYGVRGGAGGGSARMTGVASSSISSTAGSSGSFHSGFGRRLWRLRGIGELRDLAVEVGELVAPVERRIGDGRRRQRAKRRPSRRPLAHTPSDLSREAGAGLGCARHAPAGAAHQEADGRAGYEDDGGKRPEDDDQADADRADEVGEDDAGVGAGQAAVLLGGGSVGRRQGEDERGDPDHRTGAERTQPPEACLEEDGGAGRHEQDRRNGRRAPDDEAKPGVELETNHAAVPAQVLDEAQEHAQGEERPSE